MKTETKSLKFDIEFNSCDWCSVELPQKHIGTYPQWGLKPENYIGYIQDWIEDTIEYDLDNPGCYSVRRGEDDKSIIISRENSLLDDTVIKNFRWV